VHLIEQRWNPLDLINHDYALPSGIHQVLYLCWSSGKAKVEVAIEQINHKRVTPNLLLDE
jgi:hypothetical protein